MLCRIGGARSIVLRVDGAQAELASSRGITDSKRAPTGADFAPHILVNSVVLARLIARESDVLFPGTALMLAEDVAAGLLVRLDCEAPAMRTNAGIFYLRNRTLAPAAKTFIATLHEVERQAQLLEASRATSNGLRMTDRKRAPQKGRSGIVG